MTQKERKKERKKDRKKERLARHEKWQFVREDKFVARENMSSLTHWHLWVYLYVGKTQSCHGHRDRIEFSLMSRTLSSIYHELYHLYVNMSSLTNCYLSRISPAHRDRHACTAQPCWGAQWRSRRAPPAISHDPYTCLNSRRFKFVLDPKTNKLFFQKILSGLRLVNTYGKAEVDFGLRKGTLGCFESGFQGLDPAWVDFWFFDWRSHWLRRSIFLNFPNRLRSIFEPLLGVSLGFSGFRWVFASGGYAAMTQVNCRVSGSRPGSSRFWGCFDDSNRCWRMFKFPVT